MAQVTVNEARTHLSQLIRRALTGEEVIITRRGRPLVKLVALPMD
jgi:prevent-host-death family protein